jgi:pilus assembly protein CpaE
MLRLRSALRRPAHPAAHRDDTDEFDREKNDMTSNAATIDAAQTAKDFPVALVPRINIHVFATTQATATTVQQSSIDRRMTRAHVTIQLGGIPAAVQVFQSQPTPNLLVVECNGGREQVMAELASLAEVCQPETKVIVVGHVNDVILYRELMRQGISEYIVAPITSLQLIETISNLYSDPKAAPLGRILAFIGAKGGVGSSSIAHNMAWHLSQVNSIETTLTDLDLAFGTASLNFNHDAAGNIFEALSAPDRVDNTLVDRLMSKIGEKLNLLNGPGGVERDYPLEPHAVESVLNVVRYSSPLVVVDCPNVWTPWVKYTLLNADELVITATPELPSLRNAKSLIDLLRQQRPNDRPPRLIINQVGVPKRPEIPVAEFAKALGVEATAIIPYDPQSFGTAQGNGQMIFEVAPKSKAAESLRALANSFVGGAKPAKPEKKSMSSIFSNLPLMKKKK